MPWRRQTTKAAKTTTSQLQSATTRTKLCPQTPDLLALLKAAKGRPGHAPLLLRKNGEPWTEAAPARNYRLDVRAIVEKIGLVSDVYSMYAFPHTSTTRMLLKKLHTAVVAKTHDTSKAMIRKHYAANILDFTVRIDRSKRIRAISAYITTEATTSMPMRT